MLHLCTVIDLRFIHSFYKLTDQNKFDDYRKLKKKIKSNGTLLK